MPILKNDMNRTLARVLPVLLLASLWLWAGCGGDEAAEPDEVQSLLTGRFVLAADSLGTAPRAVPRYEILVAR